ncbi:MAG: glycosyltransferase family 2 protein [Betaproteobacteria bacterium]|nr:glycosyltransferase family 2 protein [Betaproteobacteria bacterium]
MSVIVPAYNCAPYIREAIESVLAQDYPNKELIVVDDGSTDGTSSVVEEFAGAVTLAKQANLGPAAARNHGARLATAEYLAFLDGDDVWLTGKLRRRWRCSSVTPKSPWFLATLRDGMREATAAFRLPPCWQAMVTGVRSIKRGAGIYTRACCWTVWYASSPLSSGGLYSRRSLASTNRCEPERTTTSGCASPADIASPSSGNGRRSTGCTRSARRR